MNRDLEDLLCNCGNNGHFGGGNNYLSQREAFFDDDNEDDIDCPRYEPSDRNDKLSDWKAVDDNSWDVISTLRSKICQLGKSETENTTVKESPHSSYTYTNRQPLENQSIVERANNLIDYAPESEFLRKIKQQCQYLQNRLPNIFSTLNDCIPDNDPYECETQCADLAERNGKSHSGECLNDLSDRKSKHVSRSKKQVKTRKIRKRKSNISDKCESENEFEPTLKKPAENSCERCWRYASPARSPVNKPDQRYDPNFRRGHSTTDFEKGDGNLLNYDETSARDSPISAPSKTGRECPCTRPMSEPRNFRSTAISTSIVNRQMNDPVGHICLKQKVEAAPPVQHLCPKHKCPIEVPEQSPLPTQQLCSKHRSSVQQPVPAWPPQNECSKHRTSLQPEPRQGLCPKHKCCAQQRESSTLRPTNTAPGDTSFSKVNELMYSPGRARDKKHQGRKSSDETSRGILCSNLEKKTRPQSCASGLTTRERRVSPSYFDHTEYKDICAKFKKESSPRAADPCHRAESIKPIANDCGGCTKTCHPPRSVRPCDQPKLECIPEGEPSKPTPPKRGACARKGTKDQDSTDANASKPQKLSEKKSQETPPKSKGKGEDSKSQKKGANKNAKSSQKGGDRGDKGGKNGKSSQKGGDKGDKNAKSSQNLRNKKSKPVHSCEKKSNPFDKAHPIRYCKCYPRIPENEFSSFDSQNGHVLCCHCDWEENTQKSVISPQSNGCRHVSISERSGNGSNEGSCSCNSNSPPDTSYPMNSNSQLSKDPCLECPYRNYANKFGPSKDQGQGGCRGKEETRRSSNEHRCEVRKHAQAFFECSPRKYFVFYMTKTKDKNENDVEVLVEELAQGCPKDTVSRNKNLADKMKKISEHPPDSMALRFQKGVSDACNVPQSSRILYF